MEKPGKKIDKPALHYIPSYKLPGQTHNGIAFHLASGDLLFECASTELHGSTGVANPNKDDPERIVIVCYTHECILDSINHQKKINKKKAT